MYSPADYCVFKFAEQAVSVCNPLQANRMADALLIADLAGRDELMRVQQMYMKKQPSPYMRVVKAIQGNDFVSESQHSRAASSIGLTKPFARCVYDVWTLSLSIVSSLMTESCKIWLSAIDAHTPTSLCMT